MSQDDLQNSTELKKNKDDNNNNGKKQKDPPPKLDYDRDWSQVNREDAIAYLRGICAPTIDVDHKLSDSKVSTYMKIQLQAAIIGVHGLVQTYGLEDGLLDQQFLHIPVASRARQMVVQWQDELEDRYQRQRAQQRQTQYSGTRGFGNVSNATSRYPSSIKYNLSKSGGNDTVITNNNSNNSNNNSNSSNHNGNSSSMNGVGDAMAESKKSDTGDDFSAPLDFGRGSGGSNGNANTHNAHHNHGHGNNGEFMYGRGMQNKRPRNLMENDDIPNLLPGFEKVWRMVTSRKFRGVKPIKDANKNVMYFWWQAGVPCASITPPHGYAEGDDINNEAFKASIKNDEFFGFEMGRNNGGWNHSRVCPMYILL